MKSPFSQLILAISVCAVSLIGYGVSYIAISDKSAAVTLLQSQIDTKTGAVSRIATTRAALAEIAGDETIVQGYFVPETDVVAFINSLETRGRTQGATVSVLSVSTGGTRTRPTISFLLSIKGTFDAVMRTIGAIEYAPYAISIPTLSMNQDAKNSWHADLTLLVGSVSVAIATTTATTP